MIFYISSLLTLFFFKKVQRNLRVQKAQKVKKLKKLKILKGILSFKKMNVITCQVGQCGNQVGENIFTSLFDEAANSTHFHQALTNEAFFKEEQNPKTPPISNISQTPSSPKKHSSYLPDSYSTQPRIAQSILIDMEPKVVNRLLETKRPGWKFDPKSTFCKEEGSGNNWAFGFNHHGPKSPSEPRSNVPRYISMPCLSRKIPRICSILATWNPMPWNARLARIPNYVPEHTFPLDVQENAAV